MATPVTLSATPAAPYLGVRAAVLLLVATYAVATVSVAWRPDDNVVAAWWPAGGLAVALVALSRPGWGRLLVATSSVVVATGLANYTAGRDVDISLALGLANAAEAVVAGLVLRARPAPGPAALVTLTDFVRLVVAVVLGAVVTALGTGMAFWALLDTAFLETARTTSTAHAAAMLVVLPLVLTWRVRGGPRTDPRELAVQVGLLGLAVAVVFVPAQERSLTFLPLTLLVWAALRFEVRVVALQLAGFATVTTVLNALGRGPFAVKVEDGLTSEVAAASLCQLYVVCAALLSVPLALLLAERNRLVAQASAEEVLFRRNFTDSLLGQILLRHEDGSLRVVDANDTAAEVLGRPRGSLLGLGLDELLATPSELGVRVAAGQSWRGRVSVRGDDSGRVEVALSRLSHADEDDHRVVWSAQLLDVSAEHVARQRLEAAERLTSATLDTTAAIILLTDLDGRIVRVNAATTGLTGWTEADLLGRTLSETSLVTSAPDLEALFLWPNRSGQPVVREGDATTRDGSTLRVLWSNNMVRDEQGLPAYAVLTGIDVTTERASAGLVSHLMRAAITTAIIGLDDHGRITVFNAGAELMLDQDAGRQVGQRFLDLLDPDQVSERLGSRDPDEAFATLVAGIGSGELPARDWLWVARDGSRRVVSMSLSATSAGVTRQVGFLCVGRDVTEQRQGQDMLVAALEKERTAVERLRALDEAKNEFVSTVSHELRTPVTSIVGYTEMLQDGTVVDPLADQLPLFDTIARNGQRLIVLCNDLLTLAGLDSESITWEAEQVDLGEVLCSVEESVAPLLTDRDLQLLVQRPDAPAVVVGDPAQLERVVLNLVTNAIKFTEDGGVVRARVEVSGDEVVLTVTDTGIGIPTEEQDNLFQKFFRSSTAQKEAIQGTGLGLSIVSAIVSAHGGTIRVRSAHLEGATFTVRLPVKY
jgi:PAS domain S-box-containing protein